MGESGNNKTSKIDEVLTGKHGTDLSNEGIRDWIVYVPFSRRENTGQTYLMEEYRTG